jgi:hypothetical protein
MSMASAPKLRAIAKPICRLTFSEAMTIAILFHFSGYRYFKWHCQERVSKRLSSYFPHPVFSRLVEFMSCGALPLAPHDQLFRRGKPTGAGFIDSTPVKARHNRRIYRRKVLKRHAERGKCSTGWLYEFERHLTINDRGEICAFYLSRGNMDGRNPTVIDHLRRELWGKFFGDRGCISRELFKRLYLRGIKLTTRLRMGMKNKLIDMGEKVLLRKRAAIESASGFLENICQVEHNRHRSLANFLVNLLGALPACSFLPHKSSVRGIYDNRTLPILV